jgi:transcriptional regulator with XRE-family HTH domain
VLAARLGVRVRRARFSAGRTQREVAAATGVSQSTISRMELGRGGLVPLLTWARVAAAVGLEPASIFRLADGHPDHATQKRCHRMVADLAAEGGWWAWTLAILDDPAQTETVLERCHRREVAIVHVWDVIGNVEAAVRDFRERLDLERRARGDGWRINGAIVVTATGQNRRRLTETGHPVAQAFSLRGDDWLMALGRSRVPMPDGLGMIWTDGRIERLRPLLPYIDFRRRNRRR